MVVFTRPFWGSWYTMLPPVNRAAQSKIFRICKLRI